MKLRCFGLVLLVFLLFGGGALASDLVVGVTAGPHEEIMEVVQNILAEEGISLRIVTFVDFVTPNLALADGDLDANSFQHIPYLEQFRTDRGLDIEWIASTVIFPMAIYSDRIDDFADLKSGSLVSIPNDPTNGGRALLLLESAGLLTLTEGVGLMATPFDIVENPHNLRITEMDAANLPRSLQDVDLAVINTNYAIEAGLNPVEDSLVVEASDSPWVNVLAVRADEQEDERFAPLVKAYQSQRVHDFIRDRFAGSVVAAFEVVE